MKDKNKKQSILSKVLHTAAKPIVVAENLSDEHTKFILRDDVLEIYNHAYQLAEFRFKEQHQKYLALGDAEIENLKQNLLSFNISQDESIEDAVVRMVDSKLCTADEIIQKAGIEAVVVATDKLEAVTKVLKFHPTYVITCLHHLSVRGGKQLLQQVMTRTQIEFRGVVPGQFKFNHRARKKIIAKEVESEAEIAASKENIQPEAIETYNDFFN